MNKPATPPKPVAHIAAATIPVSPMPVAQATPSSAPISTSMPVSPRAIAPVAPANAGAVTNLLQQTQANIAALQQMQHQTAQLHAQFLQGQEQASKTFSTLMQQQNQLFQKTGHVQSGGQVVPLPSTTPISTPVPFTTSVPVVTAPVPTPPVQEMPVPDPVAAPSNILVNTLLAIVSEKTGYPEDMLELEMSLDADLGIDSIKRVEILSALQEKIPELPTIEAEELGAIETLQDIVGKLGDSVSSESIATSPAATQASQDQLKTVLMDVVSEKTGYPVDMLDMDMSLDADLGIDSIKRVEILSALQEAMPELPTVEAEALGALETLQDVVRYLNKNAPAPLTGVAITVGVPSATLQRLLLEIVSEKTGYPDDMLDLDMSLDADLGIDSIKRVEILSALQEAEPSLPTVEAEVLGTLETLQDVIDHLNTVGSTSTPMPATVPSKDSSAIKASLIRIVAEKTGYPEDMLDVEMSLDADLGIDSIKRVEILSALQEDMPELPAVEAEDLGALETLQDVLDYLDKRGDVSVSTTIPEPTTESLAPIALTQKKNNKIQRQTVELINVPTNGAKLNLPDDAVWTIIGDSTDALTQRVIEELNSRGFLATQFDANATYTRLNAVVVMAPESGLNNDGLKKLFFDAQKVSALLLETANTEKTIFATVSRMDGEFALSGNFKGEQVITGSLAGLSKTASHEWDKVICRAIDVSSTFETTNLSADAIISTLLKDGPLEIGLSPARTVSLALNDVSIDNTTPIEFSDKDVIVVSGGARGVTAEVANRFALAGSPTLVLLGRSEAPAPEEPWLVGITDESGIKQAIMLNASAKMSPKKLQNAYDIIARNRETIDAIARMELAGSTVVYQAVDIRNHEEVSATLENIRKEYGPITGIVHGAGVLADRFIADKTPEQFNSVYDTKIEGLTALLTAVKADPVKIIVLFSSSTGRFGRKGQVDYAMANEYLNKFAQRKSRKITDCKIVAVNWGPWAGGMVTPSLRAVFESECIGLIGLKAGANYLMQELNQPTDGPSEIVILGYTEDEGVPTQSSPEVITPTLTIALNVDEYPFLKSHVIDGKAVLPVAMYVEWFAHAALHANPGLHFLGVDDVRIFKGARIDDSTTLELGITTEKTANLDDTQYVKVTLRSGWDWNVLHAQGIVRLGTRYESGLLTIGDNELGKYAHPDDEIYTSGRLFHGPDFQGIDVVTGYAESGIDVQVHPAPVPTQWIEKPQRRKWVTDPLVLDCAFQALILWSFETLNTGSLPVAFRRLTQFQSSWPKGKVIIRTRVTKQTEHQAIATIEFIHEQQQILLARIDDHESVIDPSLNEAFERSQLANEKLDS